MSAETRVVARPAPSAPTPAGAMRRAMFLAQDGVVLCMTLRALGELGILNASLEAPLALSELYPNLNEPGFGALRVAVRTLVGVGWLADEPTLDPRTTILKWTDAGGLAAAHWPRYQEVGTFLSGFDGSAGDGWTQAWSPEQTDRYLELVELASDRWRLGTEPSPDAAALSAAHLDGALVVPTVLWLHETGRLADDAPDLPNDRSGEAMARLLAALDWTEPPAMSWTVSGKQARTFALNFGGVATYLPMLTRLPELYRGELTVQATREHDVPEWHVNRELNIRISAAAHRRYFRDCDPIFLELFNREPVDAQPRFIADMGCGEGSWLLHLHGLIRNRTRRGQQLDTHPLTMVGIDIDGGVLGQARRELNAAEVPALLIRGDVTDPDGLRAALAQHGLAIEDGLHIRAIIDHERTFRGDADEIEVPGWSSGAYLDARGHALSGAAVERDLVNHLGRWRPHVAKHGMVVLEAHCVAPRVAAKHAGSAQSVALDAHQAYSKQYPVEHAVFLRCCRRAGLQSAGYAERRYPARAPFVAVSLNRLLPQDRQPLPAMREGSARRGDTWSPNPGTNLEDGHALHEILFDGGDIRYCASWCAGATGFVVAHALAVIEDRLETAPEAETIRILDYGAGTGTATIELLKACRERGIEQRLAARGVELELHLADIPSSWFAQGHALLADCAWTRFHSLRASGGGFRPLLELTAGATVDAVIASMVFHLIPPRALERAAEQLASVLGPGGILVWSSPDLGPPGPDAVLLHDPNRALREHVLARMGIEEDATGSEHARANRRILPRPLAADVEAALATRFSVQIERRTYEMLGEDIVRGLLVPSNQAEYLPEIPDRGERERLIRDLMQTDVLPALHATGAGTAQGLNLYWTFGVCSRNELP